MSLYFIKKNKKLAMTINPMIKKSIPIILILLSVDFVTFKSAPHIFLVYN